MPQMSDSGTSPHSEFRQRRQGVGNGLPSAVSCTRAISSETKAINGMMLRRTRPPLPMAGGQTGDNVTDGGAGLCDHAHQFSAPRGGGWRADNLVARQARDPGFTRPGLAVTTRTSCSIVTPRRSYPVNKLRQRSGPAVV